MISDQIALPGLDTDSSITIINYLITKSKRSFIYLLFLSIVDI